MLAALAHTHSVEIFDEPGCRAIVKLAWKQVRWFGYLQIALDIIVIIFMVLLTMSLNDRSMLLVDVSPKTWTWLLISLWIWHVLQEIAQNVGSIFMGMTRLHHSSLENWADIAKLILQGLVLFAILLGTGDSTISEWTRVLLSLCVLHTWVRLLYSLRVIKEIGLPMLPILHAMEGVSAFFFVVAFFLMGFVHMYYCLGLRRSGDSFMVMFRLAMLGAFDLYEMETVDPSYVQDSESKQF